MESRQKIYKSSIHPLVERIHELCAKHDIPLLVFIQTEEYTDNNDGESCRAFFPTAWQHPAMDRAAEVIREVVDAVATETDAISRLRVIASMPNAIIEATPDREHISSAGHVYLVVGGLHRGQFRRFESALVFARKLSIETPPAWRINDAEEQAMRGAPWFSKSLPST